MIWKSQGPWGGGPRGGGPWGGGGSGGGPGGPRPPDFEEMLRRGQDRFRHLWPGGFGPGRGIAIAIVAILLLWLASGFYRVNPDEVGIVLRFGAYNRTTQPGLNYHLPAPIETVFTPKVTRVNRTEIGYRSEPRAQQLPKEALMLTGDENIVDINFTVFWVINNARDYLFNIRDPKLTVRSAAESAMREVVGETPIASALAEGRGKIETGTRKLLQSILDSYGAGVEITQVQLQKVDPPGPVIDAYRDVQRALADRARLRNEAEAYRNNILPRARGQAVQIRQEAEAYRQQTVDRSEGDAGRFDEVYKAFKATKEVTLKRLYLETMEQVLKHSNKVIIDKSAQGGQGVLPYLPLPNLRLGSKPSGGSGSASSASPQGSQNQSSSSGAASSTGPTPPLNLGR